jgi:adenosylcobyric acid synthase
LSTVDQNLEPFAIISDAQGSSWPDGAVSEDGSIAGTYLHGVFDQADACQTLLAWAGLRDVQRMDYAQRCEADIDRLADAISDNLDLSIFEGMD